MNTVNPDTDTFLLSRYPIPLSVDEVRSLIARVKQNDEAAKKMLICLIWHRLYHRYIRPLLNISPDYKSGFLMMGASCLLIETLQAFYEGKDETEWKDGESSFRRFFQNNSEFFPNFSTRFPILKNHNNKDYCTFYKHIRCGILHQAEATGGYRILRKGLLFGNKTINANEFTASMACCIKKYAKKLRTSPIEDTAWKMAITKLGHICDNCQNQP